MDENEKNAGLNSFLVIFGLVAIVFMIGSFLNSNADYSFYGFLKYMSDCPTINRSFSITSHVINRSWGIFNGLRDFINVIAKAFDFVIFVSVNELNCLIYILYILAFIIG